MQIDETENIMVGDRMINQGSYVKEYKADKTLIYFFVSDFCSKCYANRSLLKKYVNQNSIEEININVDHPIMHKIRPRMSPTISVINSDGLVLYNHEGILGIRDIEKIRLLL